MSAETLTFAAITDRLGFSSTIWGFVSRWRLPRQRRKYGNAAVDLAERPTVAAHSQEGDQSVVATLAARIEMLKFEFARVEATAAVHRGDFERERERCERLMAEVLKANSSASDRSTRLRWRGRALRRSLVARHADACLAPAGP